MVVVLLVANVTILNLIYKTKNITNSKTKPIGAENRIRKQKIQKTYAKTSKNYKFLFKNRNQW